MGEVKVVEKINNIFTKFICFWRSDYERARSTMSRAFATLTLRI